MERFSVEALDLGHGVLRVMGSGLGFIAGNFFPLTRGPASASVAGVAFGAGVMIAGFDPIADVSGFRALILYAILEIVCQIFNQHDRPFDVVAILIAIIVAVILIVLYPKRPVVYPRCLEMR